MKQKTQIQTTRLFVSLFMSFLLVWLCNITWDLPYTFGYGDNSILSATINKRMFFSNPSSNDSLLLINTAYDKELVQCFDRYGIPIGHTDITDRSKLAILLDSLKHYNNYRYILCDILFDSSLKSNNDSILFETIANTPNIIVPNEVQNLPQQIQSKAYYSHCNLFRYDDSILKFQFMENDCISMPLKMWSDLTGKTIKRHWWGYSSGNRICNNSVVLDVTTDSIEHNIHQSTSPQFFLEEKSIYHLGSDILTTECPKELFDNKIILIGDFCEHDNHETASGETHGPLILYSAYLALEREKNIIPLFFYFLLFFIFFIYTQIVYKGGWNVRSRIGAFIINLISFSLPLEILNFITLSYNGFSVNAVLIGSLFSLFASIKTATKS